MEQNGPQVLIQCFILADYTKTKRVYISLQYLGTYYSYDALTLMGLLGYRSYIVVPPHLIFCKIFAAVGSIWKFSDIFRK